MRVKPAIAACSLLAVPVLGACGSGVANTSVTSTPPHGTPASTVGSPHRTTVPANPGTTAPSPAASTYPAATENLPVTADLRAQLLAAGAAAKHVPVSGFSGLKPGTTYYAYDASTSTFWAGAALAPVSVQAQVASQDAGDYMLFHRQAGGSWTATDAGYAGTVVPCAVPPAVLAVWGWTVAVCEHLPGLLPQPSH